MQPPLHAPGMRGARGVRMKLSAAVMLASAVALSACGTSRGRTVELPGGVNPEEQQQTQREPTFLDRMIGNDDRPNAGPCPLMGVLYDSARIVQFADAG